MADTANIALRVESHDAADIGGTWGIDAQYEAIETFDRVTREVVVLTDDNPKAVPLGDMASAALVFLRVESGGKVRARFTTTDGAQQSIAIDPVGFIVSLSVPVTAIDLTRPAGAGTVRVRVALGAPPA